MGNVPADCMLSCLKLSKLFFSSRVRRIAMALSQRGARQRKQHNHHPLITKTNISTCSVLIAVKTRQE